MPSPEYFEGKKDEQLTADTQDQLDKIKEQILFAQPLFPEDPDQETETVPENTKVDAAAGGKVERKTPSVGGLSDPYNAQYPYNQVTYTESGHVLEFDDTPGHERINIQHRSGAYIEIHPDGHIVIAANKHHQQAEELHIGVAGDAKIDVGGDMKTSVGGSAYIGARGDVLVESIGNINVKTEGRTNIKSTGTVSLVSLSDLYVQADAKVNLFASGDINATTQSTLNLKGKDVNIAATGNMTIHAGGTMDLNAKGVLTEYGSSIKMNDTGAGPATITAIPSYSFTDAELEAFATEMGDMEMDFTFDLPAHTAHGPNGETSRSRQAQKSVANRAQERGSASAYRGPGNVYVPDVEKIKVIQVRGNADEGGRDAGQVEYRNAGKKRRRELVSDLEEIIKAAAKKVNVDVIIFSGGQVAKRDGGYSSGKGANRTGSDRHDNGFGADVYLYTREFKYQYRTDRAAGHKDTQKTKAFIEACKSEADKRGHKLSAGAGRNYMKGIGTHVDIAIGNSVPEGSARHWAAAGTSRNSPAWLKGIMV